MQPPVKSPTPGAVSCPADLARTAILWLLGRMGLPVVPIGQNVDAQHHGQGDHDPEHRDQRLHAVLKYPTAFPDHTASGPPLGFLALDRVGDDAQCAGAAVVPPTRRSVAIVTPSI